MGEKLTRRDFVKLSSVAGAVLGAGATTAHAGPNPPGWRGWERVERIATNCEMCFWRCGVVAEVSDGKVVRVEGNPDHPLTKGRLCARGNAGTGLLYDPDRLKYRKFAPDNAARASSKRSELGAGAGFVRARLKDYETEARARKAWRSFRTALPRRSSVR